MKFEQALKAMKNGEKVKLPSWGGYWYWDSDKETVMIQCRPQDSDNGELLDIEKHRGLSTLFSMWHLTNGRLQTKDCPVLGGIPTFSFGEAIKYMKRGMKVKRKGWNGKSQYIQLATGISYKAASGEVVNCEHEAIGNMAVAFVGTSGVQMGWLASQADMLAD